MIRVGGFALQQEIVERFGLGIGWELLAMCRREFDNAIPAFGLFHNAAPVTNFFEHSRDDPLAAIMKSSINSVA